MKSQLVMVVDSSKCIDCKGCMVACKVENNVPQGYWRNWIKTAEPDFSDPDWMKKGTTSHYQPGGCMHCDVPTCVEACPTGATYKDERDGTVKVNENLCIGCASCVPACPYDARYRHPNKKIVDKCDYCESRRARDAMPTCVETCPTKARVFGDLNDPKSEAAQLFKKNKTVRVVNLATDTQPNMYYIADTAPKQWPVEAKAPAPINIMKKAGVPLVWAFTGLNGLAVLAMLGRQFLDRKEKVKTAESTQAEN